MKLADVLLSVYLLKSGGLLVFDNRNFPAVGTTPAAVLEAQGKEQRLEILHDKVETLRRVAMRYTRGFIGAQSRLTKDMRLRVGNESPTIYWNDAKYTAFTFN